MLTFLLENFQDQVAWITAWMGSCSEYKGNLNELVCSRHVYL